MWFFLSICFAAISAADLNLTPLDLPPLPAGYDSPGLPVGPPLAAPTYMVDNQGNTHGAAPDKGSMNGPVVSPAQILALNQHKNQTHKSIVEGRQSSSFWMDGITHGSMPLAPSGYQFYRNVMDFGATGNGVTDDTEAINKAVSAFSLKDLTNTRCGESCGSSTTLGALVYFPPGTYLISTPIIQYYYTQFIGDANSKPTIKGSKNFTGIALIDTDVYIPGGGGTEWFNQFYRQIRNFVFDLTLMNRTNTDNGQPYVPTGIHWQVAQATSLQNLDFNMPVSDSSGATTAVGIFMENGSGGFLSDLTFFGGNIGFRAGSQQYTARNLQFTSCLIAISMIWDWGFTWKNINVLSCYVALDCTNVGGIGGQGTGSISVLDSTFNGVPYAITLRNGGPFPNIVLDNLLVENSASVVLISGGETIFTGSSGPIYFESWAMGRRYTSIDGHGGTGWVTGFIDPPPIKPPSLLDSSGNIFVRSRPQYETIAPGGFIVATANNILNDGTGDQSGPINTLLSSSVGKPIFFPAGIYQIENTVNIPVGSIILGEGWSQIMGTGPYFGDALNPKVMVRVGNPGDSGVIEISDMLFTVKGPTAGAILMEWNIHESSQGNAGMWDSHFRVGGAYGTDLQLSNCPKLTGQISSKCMAATMLFHVTPFASGYFENVWAWVADHDIDEPPDGNTTTSAQINIYAARGILIESQGPCWFHGTASEHSIFYQYELSNAHNIYFGHMQTETPYFQANPDASQPYQLGLLSSDPTFPDCALGSYCEEAFALRIIDSSNILIYSAGFYSFFQDYSQSCLDNESCQEKLIETSYSQGLWIYNIFTKGAVQIVSPDGGIPPTLQSDGNQNGYTTEVSVWLVLALDGGSFGDDGNSEGGSGVVYIDPTIFEEPSPTVACTPPCTLVMPLSTMPSVTVVSFPPVSTSIVVGGSTITSLSPSPITTSVVSFWNMPVPVGQNSFTFALTSSWKPDPLTITAGGTSTTINLPPVTSPYFGPEVVTVSKTAYTVFGGFIDIHSTKISVPPETTVAQTLTIDGFVVDIPSSTTTSIAVYALPTTVVTSNGVTQTFSEAQFTQYATITAQTTITTTLTEVETSGSSTSTSTTLIAFWVQVGGFYWSPVPAPTLAPFPIPKLPSFPSIPSPPCFKLFDIFSIDCPPDKSKPTTTFKSGAPKPTCQSGCGTLCTVDCNTDGSPSETQKVSESFSTCATETATTCNTVSGQTTCNTYVGCACPTSTVTDYVVSCSGTGTIACETISSATITGCYVTGMATTTGAFCLTGFNIDPYDQGDVAPATVTATVMYVTTTLSESVVISNIAYTITQGSIVVSQTTLSVPTVVGSTTVVVIGGYTATIIPGYTGPLASPPQPTTAPATTTAAPTTTTAPPTITTPPQSTGMVVAAYTICQYQIVAQCEYQWEIYTIDINVVPYTFPGCSTDGALYSSVVTTAPDPNAIPTLGPFSIDGKSNCYFDPGRPGLSCVTSPGQSCSGCFPNGPGSSGICFGDGVSCDQLENESYNADIYCFW